jgi:type II secretory pathway component HofQ
MVDQLINENRQLKRALARAEKAQGGGTVGQAAKALSGIQRRLNRALDGASQTRRQRPAAAAAASRPRRKVTDPEMLERRRQALAKARAARQAKRQAARA